jgi:4-hydroxy-tetrahydrodipicolinate synthase
VKGIHTAMVTPFREDGTLDLPAFERLCARQIDAGIHGLVACGTTGESPTLDTSEWRAVVDAAVRVAAGRVPVTAGVGTNDTRSTVRNVEAALEAGADAGLLVFPYYNKPNPNGLRAHVREAAKPGLPLVLYHVPGRTAHTLPAPLLAELADFDGVIAVKEATGDIKYGGDLLLRTNTPILSGDDFTFLPLLSLGGTGCISVLSNVAPEQTVAVYDAYTAGHVQEAMMAMQRLWDLTTFLFSEVNPVPCKAALAHLGLCGASPRLPLAPFSGPSPAAILDAALG